MTRSGTVAVLADDLIWASRLLAAVERAGAAPVRLTTEGELRTTLGADAEAELGPDEQERRLVGVVIDLNGRRYDGAEAVRLARSAGKPVVAAAEHDDQITRKRALDAGASRVFSYNKLFTDGPGVIGRWLAAMGHMGTQATTETRRDAGDRSLGAQPAPAGAPAKRTSA